VACEVAAAGRHHMLFQGPPGVGKTMSLSLYRACSLISVCTMRLRCRRCIRLPASTLPDELITRPPYSDPHHSASVASIVGGGQRMARPGAISYAHARVSLSSKEGIIDSTIVWSLFGQVGRG
jgi:magnesium chelatase family protein